MLSLKYIRENLELVKTKTTAQNTKIDFDEIINLDKSRRELISKYDDLKSEKNSFSKKIGMMKKNGEDVSDVLKSMKNNSEEKSDVDPFNHYGKSKWEAEEVLRSWLSIDSPRKKLTIIRPTVIFGENNRGNVYNLLKQISSGRFLIVGSGNNKKSMAYVKNVVEFIKYKINNNSSYEEFNYVDVPDFSMNQLVKQVEVSLEKKIPSLHLPYIFGILGGYFFDFLKMFTKKNILISSVRVKKFCATTQFNAKKAHSTDYKPPFSLEEGLDNTIKYEFQDNLK